MFINLILLLVELRNGQYSATHWSSTLSRPKSHSLDRGLEMIGFDQG